MGLSASQARYISLVARMSDIEYQGQQINQERTTLSNQVNDLYNSLLDMSVPTPPSTTEYTEVQYSFRIGVTQYTISNVRPNGTNVMGNSYSVDLSYQEQGHFLSQQSTRQRVTLSDGIYYVGLEGTESPMTLMSFQDYINDYGITEETANQYCEGIKNFFAPEYDDYEPDEIMDEFKIYVTHEGGQYIPHFMELREINNHVTPETPQNWVQAYDYMSNGTYTANRHEDDCTLTFDEQGVISYIGIRQYDDDGTFIGYRNIALTATRVTDQAAYNDAFNKYEAAKYKYDKEQAEINAKTSIIQREDKNLELKLTRLDNERNAVNTEMEAVKKVIQDSIEKGFKTFSG